MSEGQRECEIYELSDLLKCVNIAREAGCNLAESVRDDILGHKSMLLEDKAKGDCEWRHS